MKKHLVALTCSALFSLAVSGQTILSNGAKALFKGVKSKLTVDEKNRIFTLTTLTLANDTVFELGGDVMEQVNIYPVDLNNDGVEEVVVTYAGSVFGMANYMFQLYTKKAGGNYTKGPEDFAGIASFTPTVTLGYPDMVVGGPGFEYPLYKWDGKAYKLAKTITDNAFSKMKITYLEDLSKAYTDGIK